MQIMPHDSRDLDVGSRDNTGIHVGLMSWRFRIN